jgi:hypothetical protein
MGDRGPIPKRDDQRIRRNAEYKDIEKVTEIGPVPIPPLGFNNAHPLVEDLYRSLTESAQNRFFEPSDWQYARLAMYALNEMLQATNKEGEKIPFSAMKLQTINQMFSDLLMTEGDRRRVRLEIERNQPSGPEAQVLSIADKYRDRLGLTQ